MENKIKEVMSSVLEIDISEIDENSSPETIEKWDSLKQMNLVVALEEEFGIVFTDEELVQLINYKLIRLILQEKLKGAS